MYKMFVSSVAMVAVVAFCLNAQEEKEPTTPKGVTVDVKFPKTMKVTGDPKPGAITAQFDIEVDVKNDSKEGVVFSGAMLGVKSKGLAGPQIRIKNNGPDALNIEPGKSYKTTRTVEFSMFGPEVGKEYEIEVRVYGTWKKGTVKAVK